MATLKVGRASDNELSATQKAKQTWYADAEGNPTTDASKAAQHIAEKGRPILPHIATKYGFVDGDISKKGEAKGQAPSENKAVESKESKTADPKAKK